MWCPRGGGDDTITMITDLPTSMTIPGAPIDLESELAAIQQQRKDLAEREAVLKREAQERAAAARRDEEARQKQQAAEFEQQRRAIVATLPGQLGLRSLGEVISFLRQHQRPSLRGKTIGPEGEEQMRLMFLGGATGKEVAKAMGCSLATVWTKKGKLGLVGKGLGGVEHAKGPRARKAA